MTSRAVLRAEAIRLGLTAEDRFAAIRTTGQILVELGAVLPAYVDAMCDRERSISTYIGEGIAIPHGTLESRPLVQHAALSVAQFPDGVLWDGRMVYMCVGIASATDEHINVLSRLSGVLQESDAATELRTAQTPDKVLATLGVLGPRRAR
jgi:mannitol/fructose-specific phosphotransferase system IIA component